MRKLPPERRAAILSALVEGSSVNSTARMCGVSKITVLRLLSDAGSLAAELHDLMVRQLQTRRVEVDELWSFVGAKEASIARGARGHGDAWVWVAMDADSKLVISYHVGDRDGDNAKVFMKDVASRLLNRVQLTSDGLSAYTEAVETAFGGAIDYSMLIKQYQAERVGEARYSPPKCTGCVRRPIQGNPNPDHISTSYIERQNLSVRMGSRRFTRLTNCYSKRLENHVHAVALHYWHFNFARKHATLKTTPAVAVGIADRPMTMLDFVHLLEREEKIRGGRLTAYLPAVTACAS